eukprot:CAMPEP_0113698776 /NCGR_PEP_ID=MMETSP0038_2-20120614/22908_1 /TAXON_ID=2898 /ORGANISM="Cryptomonas paramecium" /LENGTH=132 /DNA_ID=CAMNT_0000621997 /DNA_START=59 /DNA_END=459 /DNA_ORIENTATION=+ /assembly_acc=CAM_ASM_000170
MEQDISNQAPPKSKSAHLAAKVESDALERSRTSRRVIDGAGKTLLFPGHEPSLGVATGGHGATGTTPRLILKAVQEQSRPHPTSLAGWRLATPARRAEQARGEEGRGDIMKIRGGKQWAGKDPKTEKRQEAE